MKNYDDLQRFKEKTQTLDIAFKDMSGQLQEPAGNSQWALIRQLANEEAATPFSGSQRIDLPQPQPLRGDEFQTPAASSLMRQPAALHPAMATRSTILDSLAGSAPATAAPSSSLFPPPPEAVPVSAPQPAPAAVQPAQTFTPPLATPAPRAEPRRFGGLFRARHSEPVSLSKETLLKPLLEKIALCR